MIKDILTSTLMRPQVACRMQLRAVTQMEDKDANVSLSIPLWRPSGKDRDEITNVTVLTDSRSRLRNKRSRGKRIVDQKKFQFVCFNLSLRLGELRGYQNCGTDNVPLQLPGRRPSIDHVIFSLAFNSPPLGDKW